MTLAGFAIAAPNLTGVSAIAVQPDGKIIVGGTSITVNGAAHNHIARLLPDGTLDATFNPNFGDSINAIAVQGNGKIVVGGGFTSVNGIGRNYLARLEANGALDMAFNPSVSVRVRYLASYADDRLIVGGWTAGSGGSGSIFARLNANGTWDSTFQPNVGGVSTLALQADGSVVFPQNFVDLNQFPIYKSRLRRVAPNGTLDNTFNVTRDQWVDGITIQGDGKILFGFQWNSGEGGDNIARYTPTGVVDGTIGLSTPPQPQSSIVNCLCGSADGTFVAFARIFLPQNVIYDVAVKDGPSGFYASGTSHIGALLADGTVVLGNGQRLSNTPATQTLIATGSSVQWLRGGSSPETQQVSFELSTNGGATWTFLGVGQRMVGGWELTGLTLPASGQIRARARTSGGQLNGSSGLVEKVSLFPGGTEISVEQPAGTNIADGGSKAFGSAEVGASNSLTFTIRNYGDSDLTGLGVTIDGPDAAMFTMTANPTPPVAPLGGTTFTVRFAPTSGGNKNAVLHIASNDADESPFDIMLTGGGIAPGSVDPSFSGSVTGNSVLASAAQPDGRIVIGGLFTSVSGQPRNNFARLNTDGSVESTATFNAGTGANEQVYGVALQADGKIVIGGAFTSVKGQARGGIARLLSNGNVEGTATFNAGTGADNVVYGVALQSDGKIVLCGEFTSVNSQALGRIARLNADGSVESAVTFDAGTGADAGVQSVVVQADGKIVLGGQFMNVNGLPRNRIARLNANGTVESTATFDAGTGADGLIHGVALQADTKILIVGDFTNVNGRPRNRIARLNADGTIESTATFDPGAGANGPVYGVALQADGKILLAGDFTSVNGEPRNRIARLNPDGSLESIAAFNIGSGANDFVGGVTLQADGKILLCGGFTQLDGQPRNLVARLANDAASSALTIPTSARVQWMRGGTGPEVEQVTFEFSTNGGTSWGALGSGTRIAGGWEHTGLSLSGPGQIRARGRTSGGAFNGSSGIVEQIATYDFVTQAPTLTAPATNAQTTSPVSIAFTLPEAALAGSVKLTFNDGVTPRVLTLAASQETTGAHAFSFYITSPLISPAIASGPALPDGTYSVTVSYQDALGNPPANSTPATNVRIARQRPTLPSPVTGTATVSPLSVSFNLPEPTLSGSLKLTFDDGVTARVLILAASQETVGAHAFSFDIANPLASPAVVGGPALPEGTYTVTLSSQDALNQSANSAPATNVRIASTPMHLWNLVQFGNLNAADLGNIDGDAFVHLAEYGLVLSPVAPNPPLAVTRFTYAEGARLRMFLTRDPTRNDVTVEVQAGPALTGPWTIVATSALGAPFTGGGYVGGDSAGAGLKTVEVRDVVNMNAAAARYLRVKVTH